MGKKKKKSKFTKQFKKTWRGARKSQSNKLIYAVAGGLSVILIVFVILSISGDKRPQDKEKVILKSVKYLTRVALIKEVKAIPEENKVVIIFDNDVSAGRSQEVDFKKMARYAGIRVSHELKDEEIKVLLSEINKKEKDYLVTIKNGTVISEQLLE